MKFVSFGHIQTGRVITSFSEMAVVQSRNPYGGHNLVLVNLASGEAVRHGNLAVTEAAANWFPRKKYQKIRSYLSERGIGLDWVTLF